MTIDEIAERNDDVRRNARALLALTGRLVAPDKKEFTDVRLAFFRAQRRHLTALPKEEYSAALPGAEGAVRALRNRSTAFYGSSSLHVARWHWDAIAGDWDGYRSAVSGLMPQLLSLLDEEVSLLRSFRESQSGA